MRRASGLLALFFGLAVLHTWPLASDLSGLSRLDNDDAGLNVFVVSWVAHILPRQPLALFDAPMFFPEPRTLAYSEHMFVPSLMGAPLLWAGVAPATVYNLLVLAGFVLSGWVMALVVRRWTGSTRAGITAGMLYAFNAHLLTRLVHLQALHMEFLPLALLGFDLVLRSERRRIAPATALLAAAFVLQALCSNYTLVFMSVALMSAALVRASEWVGSGRWHRLGALTSAGAVAVLLVGPFLWPYYVVSRELGLSRPLDEVALYSATWADYLATGGRLHYAWWSHQWFEGRTALFPGITALLLAVRGTLGVAGGDDRRVRMMVAMGLAGFALSFGPALPGYSWLHTHVPLLEGLRAAARWGVLPLTAIAVLAGFAVAGWERRWGSAQYWPAASLAVMAVLTLEALRAPLGFAGVPAVPAAYDRLHHVSGAIVVELPLFSGPSVSENARYLFSATHHFRPLVNGYSGFEPLAFRERAERWRRFPAPEVIAEMRALGVTHVVLHPREMEAAQVNAAAAHPALERIDDAEGLRVYRLRPEIR